MFDIDGYLQRLLEECKAAFGERLVYMGLQGSFLRGEANENSDIDIMLVIDRLSVADMDAYRGILQGLGHYDRSCGFICGKNELARWNPMEVCQLIYTTKDICGSLKGLLPPASREDEINYVKLSLGNIYHELCHRYIHTGRENSRDKLRATCKSLFFAIQNLYYVESGEFVPTKSELKRRVSEADRWVLELSELPEGYDFDKAFDMLICWFGEAFERIERAV